MPKRFDGLSDSSNLLRVYDTTFIREEPFGKSSGKTTRTTTTISSSLWKDFFLVLSATITTYLTKDFFFGLLNSLFLIRHGRLENFKKSRLKKTREIKCINFMNYFSFKNSEKDAKGASINYVRSFLRNPLKIWHNLWTPPR